MDNVGGAGERGERMTGRTVSLEPEEPVEDRFCSRVRKNAGKREAGAAGVMPADCGDAGGSSAFRKNAGKREAPLAAGARLVVTLLVAWSRAEIWASDGSAAAAGERGRRLCALPGERKP